MRHLRANKSFLHGTQWITKGEVFAVDNDYRAAQIVAAKDAEYVASVEGGSVITESSPPPVETAESPGAANAERATGRRTRG